MNLYVWEGSEDILGCERGESMVRMYFINNLFSIKNEIMPLSLCLGTINCFLKKTKNY